MRELDFGKFSLDTISSLFNVVLCGQSRQASQILIPCQNNRDTLNNFSSWLYPPVPSHFVFFWRPCNRMERYSTRNFGCCGMLLLFTSLNGKKLRFNSQNHRNDSNWIDAGMLLWSQNPFTS